MCSPITYAKVNLETSSWHLNLPCVYSLHRLTNSNTCTNLRLCIILRLENSTGIKPEISGYNLHRQYNLDVFSFTPV